MLIPQIGFTQYRLQVKRGRITFRDPDHSYVWSPARGDLEITASFPGFTSLLRTCQEELGISRVTRAYLGRRYVRELVQITFPFRIRPS